MGKSKSRVMSRTEKGGLSLPDAEDRDLALGELRERLLSELDALAELDRAGERPYKLVLIVKRTKKRPLSYKLVVERVL